MPPSESENSKYWRRKLNAFLHDSPDKATDIQDHERRAYLIKSIFQFGEQEHFEKSADWQASSADRIPFPHHTKFKQGLKDLKSFNHPMGVETTAKGENFKSSEEALEIAQKSHPYLLKGNEDARASFICAWRFWRNWASSIDERFTFLPADTRIPDHSIWHHLTVTSAFQGALPSREQKVEFPNEDLRPRLVLFSIGPVQDFIAAARSTRDLWSGSYLLSYLVSTALGQIAKDFGPDHVIFPNLLDQPLIDHQLSEDVYEKFTFDGNPIADGFDYKNGNLSKLLTPSLPNRFLALLPARSPGSNKLIDEYAAGLVEDIQGRLSDIAKIVSKCITANLDEEVFQFDKDIFDTQVKKLLEVQWQTLPIPNTIKELKETADQHLPKDCEDKDFTPRKAIDAILDMEGKCNSPHKASAPTGWALLNALIAWLHDGVKSNRSFDAWRPGRWQSGKEFNKDALNGKEEAVFRVIGDKEEVEKFCSKDLEMSEGTFKPGELLGASTLIKRIWHHTFLPEYLDIDLDDLRKGHPMPNTYSIAKGNPFAQDDRDGTDEKDGQEKYFAVIALDGDQMGKWISGSKSPKMRHCLSHEAMTYYEENCPDFLDAPRAVTPSWHLQFSEALGNFSFHAAQRIIEAHDGRLIYAGGDDVLAMLPAKDALNCARNLRAAFRGEKETLNKVKGIITGEGTERKSDRTTRLFDVSDEGYLKLHKDSGGRFGDAKGVLSDPVNFPALVPGPAADVSVGIAIAHYKSPLQDVVKAAQAAEKRAKRSPEKGGLDRSAVAISIFKRSGEILEWGTKWYEEERTDKKEERTDKNGQVTTNPTSIDSAGYSLLNQLVANLLNADLNARFPHKLEALLTPYLSGSEGMQTDLEFEGRFSGIIELEINHCLNRNDGGKLDGDGKKQFILYWDQLNETTEASFTSKLTLFINLLRTAAWIARGSEKNTAPSTDKAQPTATSDSI